jgi:hypothetical protein
MRLAYLLVLLPALAFAQGVQIKSGASSDLATVNTAKSLLVVRGKSSAATYICSAGGLATTAAYAISLESEVSRGFRIQKICVGTSVATAAALQTVTVRRETAASSGVTAITAEGTGTSAVSRMDPDDGNWGGVCRLTGTAGTAGALLDTFGWTVGELGAGTADPGGPAVYCRTYGDESEKAPRIVSGVANGVDVRVTAAGAGGLASGFISITFTAE